MMLLPSLVLRVMASSSEETRSMAAILSRRRSRMASYLARFWNDGFDWKLRRELSIGSLSATREADSSMHRGGADFSRLGLDSSQALFTAVKHRRDECRRGRHESLRHVASRHRRRDSVRCLHGLHTPGMD